MFKAVMGTTEKISNGRVILTIFRLGSGKPPVSWEYDNGCYCPMSYAACCKKQILHPTEPRTVRILATFIFDDAEDWPQEEVIGGNGRKKRRLK